jgi:hypothetical protein
MNAVMKLNIRVNQLIDIYFWVVLEQRRQLLGLVLIYAVQQLDQLLREIHDS